MKLRLVLKLSLCVFLILISTACKKKEKPALDCTPVNENATTSLLVFDVEPPSPYFEKELAYFYFDQSIVRYRDSRCGENSGSIKLSVKNASVKQLYLEYTLIGYNKARTMIIWNYSNSITLPPKGQIDVGEISKSTQNVTSKYTSMGIETNKISYQ
jgi:hypothetical protein